MTKKFKFSLVLLIILAILSVAILASCTNVDVQEIRISEDSVVKTDYFVGEDLNIENIFIDVVRTDMKVKTYSLIENLGLFTVSNFSSSSEATNLPVIIRYKDVQVTYHVNIRSPQSIDSLIPVKLHMGLDEAQNVEIKKSYGDSISEAEINRLVPTREGYVFDGWYKDEQFLEPFDFVADQIYYDKNTNLYVKWAKIHKVRFLIRPGDDKEDRYKDKIYQMGDETFRVVDEYSNIKDGDSLKAPPVPEIIGKLGTWSTSLFVDIRSDINAIANYTDLFFSASFKYRSPEGIDEEIGTIENIAYGENLIETHSEEIIGFTNRLPEFPEIEFLTEDWENVWDAVGLGTSIDNVRRDTEFFAIPKIRKINVKFDLNYDTGSDPRIYTTEVVEYGKMIRRPEDPQRSGYAFKGWYDDPTTTKIWKFNSEQLQSSGNQVIIEKLLYAKWVPLYKVEFFYQPNGVDYEPYNIFENGTVNYEYKEFGTNYTLPEPPEIQGHNVKWNSQSPILIDGNKQFKTTVEKKIYDVVFYDENGDMVGEVQKIRYLESAIPPTTEPSRFGYDFAGYSDDYESVKQNLNLYPKFDPVTVRVIFDFRYGGYEIESEAKFDRSYFEFEPSEYKNREGYNFIGWSTIPGANEPNINVSDPIDTINNVRLYAVWKQKFTLTFNNFQSSGVYTVLTIEEGKTVNLQNIPDAEAVAKNNSEAYANYAIGYDFVWRNFENQNALDILQYPVESSHVFDVTPQLKKYKVEFLIAGSKDVIPPKFVEHGKALSTIHDFPTETTINNNIVREQYEEFTTESLWRFRGSEYNRLQLIEKTITSDVVVEPILVVKTFLVQWKSDLDNNAELYYEAEVAYNNKAIYNGEEVIREGYTFDFWQVIKEDNVRADRQESKFLTDNVKKDLILVPEFVPSRFQVKFLDGFDKSPIKDSKNDDVVVDVSYGDSLNIDELISLREDSLDKEGKLYTGWSILSGQKRINVNRYHNIIENERYWQLKHDLVSNMSVKEINSVLVIYKSNFYTIPNAYLENLDQYLADTVSYLPESESSIPTEKRFLAITKENDGWKVGDDLYNEQYIRFKGGVSNNNDILDKNLYLIVEDETIFESSYDEVIFKVQFDIMDVAIENPSEFIEKNIRYGYPVQRPQDPIPTTGGEKIFLGWYTDDNFINRWSDFSAPVRNDMTLYAKWDNISFGTPGAAVYDLDANREYAIVQAIDPNKITLTGGIEIANYYEGRPVKEIADYAFANAKNSSIALKSVILPNTLELIGTKAFADLKSIEEIIIPAMVKNIGIGAFDGCTNLRSIKFENGSELKTIGSMAFYNAKSLKYSNISSSEPFELPDSLISIGDYAFYGCEQIKGLAIPKNVEEIGNSAFENCTNLSYVFFNTYAAPGIGTNVFRGQYQQNNAFKIYVLDEIIDTYKSSQLVENYPGWAPYISKIYSQNSIYYDENSKPEWSYEIKDNNGTNVISLLQYLGDKKEVIVPRELQGYYLQVNMISDYAFGLGIEKIEISLDFSVGQYTFSSANDLKNIKIEYSSTRKLSAESLIEAYKLPNMYKIEVATNTPLNALFGGGANIPTKIREVEIYSSFTQINNNFFQDCDFVKKVIFYTTAQNIGREAFANMRSLEEVVIHEAKNILDEISKITNIGEGAFRNSYRLQSFKYSLGEDFETLYDGIIPHSFNVGADILEGTAWLNNYQSEVVIIGDNILYKYIGINGETRRKYVVPSSIKQIAQKAFMGVSYIEAIIPETLNSSDLTFVGPNAFANMSSLEMVVFPDTSASQLTVSAGVFEKSRQLSVIVWGLKESNSVLTEGLRFYFGDESYALPIDDASTGLQKSGIQLYYNKDKEANWSISSIFKDVNAKAFPGHYENLSYGIIDDEISWLYADVWSDGAYKKTLIKYLAESNECVVPNNIDGGAPFLHYGGYVFSRKITSLDLKANILPFSNSFNGIYRLNSLSISGGTNINDYKLIGSKINTMINTNVLLTALSLNGLYPIDTILSGNALNSRIKTINILSGAQKIADNFLYNASNIKYMNILSNKNGESYVTPLEELVEDKESKGITFNDVGAKAFWGTEWIDRYESDYIVVLDKILVDYKGSQSVLDFSNILLGDMEISVNAISSGAFKDNKNIEALYIPTTLTKIGDEAFRRADKLTTIFVLGDSAVIPEITDTVFAEIAPGYRVYAMNEEILNNMESISQWHNLNPRLMPKQIVIEGEKWLSKRSGVAYLNVYLSEYLIDTTDPDHSILEWQRELYRTYIVDSVVEDLNYDLSTLKVHEEVELEKVIVPWVISDGINSYTITKIGNNAFLNAVEEIGFGIDVELSDNTFANKNSFSTLRLITKRLNASNDWEDINLEDRAESQSAEKLKALIDSKGINKIVYFGNYTLDEIFKNSSNDILRAQNITSIEIAEGATETVNKMLTNWTWITSFKISNTVKKLGVLSLEDTAWYKNYTGYVVVGDILYKYKGASTDIRLNIPLDVNIINTGAFSKVKDASLNSWDEVQDWDKLNLSVNTINFNPLSRATTVLDFAFANCLNLNIFNAPSTLTNISANAFTGTAVYVLNDFIYSVDQLQRLTLLKYVGNETTVILNENVKMIAARAFAGTHVKTFIIPDNSYLEYIGKEAFADITELNGQPIESFNFSYNKDTSRLLGIGKNAFPDCFSDTALEVRNEKIIIYNRPDAPMEGLSYEITDNIISITEGAIRGYTSIVLKNKSNSIPQEELKSVLSYSTVKRFESYGIYSLEELIGTNEPLDNIEEIAFLEGTTGIAPNFVNGWKNIKLIDSAHSVGIERIGENAFSGTRFLVESEIKAKEENYGVSIFGESGILIAYSGDADVVLNDPTIKAIMSDVFRGNTAITSIDLTETSIKELPAHIFEGCFNLANIELPENIEYIGEKAFYQTAWLDSQAEDLIVINGQLIAYKGGPEAIIDSRVKKINSYVFNGNRNVAKIIFAKDNIIDYIEPHVFANMSSLEEVVLNENIERIAPTAFLNTIYYSRNRNIYYIENPNDLERMHKKLILTTRQGDYELDNQVTEVSKYAFESGQITGIVIGASSKLTFLPDGLFANCSNISRISITKNGMVYGKNLFNKNIPYINTAQPNAEGFVVIGNSYLLSYKGTATNIEIPQNVKYINEHAFANANSLEKVSFNKSLVRHIPEGLFSNLSNLTFVEFDRSYIKTIGKDAFKDTAFYNNLSGMEVLGSLLKYDTAVTELSLPSEVKYIPDSFFENSALTKITLNGPTIIGNRAFINSVNLAEIENDHYIISIGKDALSGTMLYENAPDLVKVGNIIIGYKSDSDSVTIDTEVKRISSFAFADNKNLKTLIFEERNELSPTLYIEDRAFRNCEELEFVDFSPVVSKISYLGNGSFDNTKYLRNLASSPNLQHVVVDGVLLLLTYKPAILTIDKSITRIVGGLAKNNSSIARLDVLPQLNVGETYTLEIGEEAFWNAFNLRTRNISSNAKEVIDENAFAYTYWQKTKGKLVVSESGQVVAYNPETYEDTLTLTTLVNSIYPYVLKENRALKTVDMRNSRILNMNTNAFDDCPNLETIYWSININSISKEAVENSNWYAALPDGPYVYDNKLLFVKGATGQNYTLNDANIYVIKKGSLDEFTTLAFGANMSTNTDNQLRIDDGAIDHITTITVPADRLVYFRNRFTQYADKFVSE